LNEGATAGDYVKTDGSFSGSAPAPDYSGFGDAFGGATAYYSLRQFTEAETLNAIRVRRSSDDTEQDIGFDSNGDLDSTALTTFVNEETTFLNDTFDGSYSYTAAVGSASVTGGVLDFPDTSNTIVFTSLTNTLKTQQVRVTFTILNYVSGDIKFENYSSGAQGTTRSANGTYVETLTIASSGNNNFGFSGTMQGQIDDFKIEQLTADGAVTTFYDQTGNGNDATNSTESEQPLIVDGGTLVEENGKAAVDFDGVNYVLVNSTYSYTGTDIPFSIIYAGSFVNDAANQRMVVLGTSSTSFSAINGLSTTVTFNGSSGGGDNKNQTLATGTFNGTQHLIEIYSNGTTGTGALDGSAVSLDTDYVNAMNYSGICIGGFPTFSFSDMKGQEIIIFESDQSSNRTGIESNINDHFDIYTP